jgi:hypothetical protein
VEWFKQLECLSSKREPLSQTPVLPNTKTAKKQHNLDLGLCLFYFGQTAKQISKNSDPS